MRYNFKNFVLFNETRNKTKVKFEFKTFLKLLDS